MPSSGKRGQRLADLVGAVAEPGQGGPHLAGRAAWPDRRSAVRAGADDAQVGLARGRGRGGP